MEERVYEVDKKDKKQLDDLLKADPYAEMSFSRVAPQIKELDEKVFLYINADAEFFKFADEKFKAIPSIKKASKEDEEKVKSRMKAEEESASSGFGNIFGE